VASFFLLYLFDEVDEYFSVGIAMELMSAGKEGFLDHGVVFNDSVVDNRQALVARSMRVCVSVVRFAVGCPAGMADTGSSAQIAGSGKFFEGGYLSGLFKGFDSLMIDQGDSGTVITSVFEAFQTFDNNGPGLIGTDVSD